MESIYSKARGKVNLNLQILNKREDNYHNLKSVFQKISLYDELYITKTNSDKMEMKINIEELNNENNIIYKAYIKLKEKYPQISGIEVKLIKNIPMQAGLAGGSTDCACFLKCMNKLFDLNMSTEELIDIGCSLGADVPPCLYDRAIYAEGIGEIITPINTNFKYYFVIVKPKFACSTGKMFNELDEMGYTNEKDISPILIEGLEQNNIEKVSQGLYNSFEKVKFLEEFLPQIKKDFMDNGAFASLMTGAGSCVFGIFKTRKDALTTYKKLKNKYETYICVSYNKNKEV